MKPVSIGPLSPPRIALIGRSFSLAWMKYILETRCARAGWPAPEWTECNGFHAHVSPWLNWFSTEDCFGLSQAEGLPHEVFQEEPELQVYRLGKERSLSRDEEALKFTDLFDLPMRRSRFVGALTSLKQTPISDRVLALASHPHTDGSDATTQLSFLSGQRKEVDFVFVSDLDSIRQWNLDPNFKDSQDIRSVLTVTVTLSHRLESPVSTAVIPVVRSQDQEYESFAWVFEEPIMSGKGAQCFRVVGISAAEKEMSKESIGLWARKLTQAFEKAFRGAGTFEISSKSFTYDPDAFIAKKNPTASNQRQPQVTDRLWGFSEVSGPGACFNECMQITNSLWSAWQKAQSPDVYVSSGMVPQSLERSS